MAAPETAPPFADVFAPASEEQWRQKVETALKGAPFARLISKTYDGFDIAPLYPRASGKPRAFRGAGDWAPTARVDHPDGAQANALALADLENGAAGLHVVFAGAAGRTASACKTPRNSPRRWKTCGSTRACASCSTCPAMPTPSSPPSKPWSPLADRIPKPSTLARPRSARRGGPFRRAPRLGGGRPRTRRKGQGAERKRFCLQVPLAQTPPDISIVTPVRLQGGCRIAATGKYNCTRSPRGWSSTCQASGADSARLRRATL